MFKNQYQTGVSMQLINCTGAGANLFYKNWRVRGCITRGYDSSAKSYTFRFQGPKPPQVSIPKDERQGLMIVQAYVAFQVWLTMCPELHVEVVVTDNNGVRRRLFFSDGVKELQITELHSRIPIPPNQLIRGKWANLALNVQGYFQHCYPTLSFRSIDYLSVAGFFKLKRIFTLRDLPAPAGPYCIQSLYPGADLNKAEHIACKHLQFGPGILGANISILPPKPEPESSPLDYLYHSQIEGDASTITYDKFPSLDGPSPTQSPLHTSSVLNKPPVVPEEPSTVFPPIPEKHSRHVSQMKKKPPLTGFSNVSGMSNTYNNNPNSPFRIQTQKRKSINPSSAYSVNTDQGFSSSTNLDATLRGLKKQIHQTRHLRGAALSATEQRKKAPLSPLPLVKNMKKRSLAREPDTSSIRLPPLDSQGETDSIKEQLPRVRRTPSQRSPMTKESDSLPPLKINSKRKVKVSSRKQVVVAAHSATSLRTKPKQMKRQFSKILEKGQEFEVRRSQSSLKKQDLASTPQQRVDRKNRPKRNPMSSKVFKSQQRKFINEPSSRDTSLIIAPKGSSIKATRQPKPPPPAQDRASVGTREEDVISPPYKPKRPRPLYDSRGHRIKAKKPEVGKNRDLHITPWSEEEGSGTSPKAGGRHQTTNSQNNNNFEEESADSRFNTHTFYLYKQKMEALRNKQNTSAVENLSTAGMGIVSGPEPIYDDEIQEEIHVDDTLARPPPPPVNKLSNFMINAESPEVPEEDLSPAPGPTGKFGTSTFYDYEKQPIERPYSPPFAGATPVPKALRKSPVKPLREMSGRREEAMARVTTDLLRQADKLLGVEFDIDKQCYVDTHTQQVYSLYD